MFPWRNRTNEAEGVRPAAVAGKFYPAAPARLRQQVLELLAERSASADQARPVSQLAAKALIVPHAGYIYSGPIAASAYARLQVDSRPRITRAVMLGPAHRVRLAGLAGSRASGFATPLGVAHVDQNAFAELADLPQVEWRDDAHQHEHCLEVQLPFLQVLLEKQPSLETEDAPFSIIPLLVGRASIEQVRQVLERLWGGDETLIVVTSDLSHYQDYDTARQLDAAGAAAIVAMNPDALGADQACGQIPIRALIQAARERCLLAELLDLRSSGDTGGDRQRVVGYGALAFSPGLDATK